MNPLLLLLLLPIGFAGDEKETITVVVTQDNVWVNAYTMFSFLLTNSGYLNKHLEDASLSKSGKKLKARCLNIGKNCKLIESYDITDANTIENLQKNKSSDKPSEKAILLCNLIMNLNMDKSSNSKEVINCPILIKRFEDIAFILEAMDHLEVDVTNRSILSNFYNTYLPGFFNQEINEDISISDWDNKELFPLYWRINTVMNYIGYFLTSYFDETENSEVIEYSASLGVKDLKEQMNLLRILAMKSCIKVYVSYKPTKKRNPGPLINMGYVVGYLRTLLLKTSAKSFVVVEDDSVNKSLLLLWNRENDCIFMKHATVKSIIDCIDGSADTVKGINITTHDLTIPFFKYLKGRTNLGASVKVHLKPTSYTFSTGYADSGNEDAFLKQMIESATIFLSRPSSGYFDLVFEGTQLVGSLPFSFWRECKLLAEVGCLRIMQVRGLSRSIVSLGDELDSYLLEYRNIPGILYHFKDFISRFPDDVKVVRNVNLNKEAFTHTFSVIYNAGRSRVPRLNINISIPEHLSISYL